MLRISAGAGTGWRLIIDQFPRPANHHSASRELGNGNDPVPLTARGPCLAAWAAAGMLPLLLLVPRTPGRAYPQMRRTRVADRPAAATTAPAAQIAGRSPSGLHDGPPCSVETASRSRYGNVDRPPDASAPPDARDRAPTHKPDLLLRRHTLSKPVVADQVWRGKRAGDCEHAAGSSSCPRPRRSPAPFAQAGMRWMTAMAKSSRSQHAGSKMCRPRRKHQSAGVAWPDGAARTSNDGPSCGASPRRSARAPLPRGRGPVDRANRRSPWPLAGIGQGVLLRPV